MPLETSNRHEGDVEEALADTTHTTPSLTASESSRLLPPDHCRTVEPATSPPASPNALRVLLLAVFIYTVAIAVTLPVRPRIFVDAAHGDPQLAATLHGITDFIRSAVVIISGPLIAATSDLSGRKPMLLLSTVGELISLLIIAYFFRSPILLVTAFFVQSFTDAFITMATTIVADLSATRSRSAEASTESFGMMIGAFGVSMLIGPLIGGQLATHFGVTTTFLTGFGLMLLAIAVVAIFLPETRRVQSRNASIHELFAHSLAALRTTRVNPIPRIWAFVTVSNSMRWLMALSTLDAFASTGTISILLLYLRIELNWGTQQIGIYLSVIGAAIAVSCAIVAPRCVSRFGERATLTVGFIFRAIHGLLVGFARSSAMMYVAVMFEILAAVRAPILNAIIARQTSADRQGRLQGSFSALKDVAHPIAGASAAALFVVGQRSGVPGLPFFLCAGVVSFCAGIAGLVFNASDLK